MIPGSSRIGTGTGNGIGNGTISIVRMERSVWRASRVLPPIPDSGLRPESGLLRVAIRYRIILMVAAMARALRAECITASSSGSGQISTCQV